MPDSVDYISVKRKGKECLSIKKELDKKGIILNDTINGTTWDIKALYKIV